MKDRNCIREWLLTRPLPIRQIAMRASISRETVYRIMRNGSGSRHDVLERLWKVMKEEKKKTARP